MSEKKQFAGSKADQILTLAIVLPLLITGFGLGAYFILGVGGMAVAAYSRMVENDKRHRMTPEEKAAHLKMVRDTAYVNICPNYFKANWFDKLVNYRKISWCEEYRHLMPESELRAEVEQAPAGPQVDGRNPWAKSK